MTMLKADISRFENSIDPDQLASQKPADQDPHCFLLFIVNTCFNWNPASELDRR